MGQTEGKRPRPVTGEKELIWELKMRRATTGDASGHFLKEIPKMLLLQP